MVMVSEPRLIKRSIGASLIHRPCTTAVGDHILTLCTLNIDTVMLPNHTQRDITCASRKTTNSATVKQVCPRSTLAISAHLHLLLLYLSH